MHYTLGVIGATGIVGEELLAILAAHNIPPTAVKAFASQDALGESLPYGDDEIAVSPLDPSVFQDLDLAFFCVPDSVAGECIPIALQSQCVVIDTSRHFRLHPKACLFVPSQTEALLLHQGLIALPNPLSLALTLALEPLHEECELTRLCVTAFESVSGAGRAGVEELEHQIRDLMNMRDSENTVFPRQIAFNTVPQTAPFAENDYTDDELDCINETRALLNAPDLCGTATSVYVPTFFCHALSVNATFENPITAKECRAILSQIPAIHLVDNPMADCYPTMLDCGGEDAVFVGRIRPDTSHKNTLNLWIVLDNVRYACAKSCVTIYQYLCDHDLVRVTPNLLER
ncbi:MAG: aspartate-semialdehyde dehydrogenase [Desulfovibrio sp.]|nr:aspartate-semialdehyde dehydrogenase [Desulfovibrio sp.]